MHTGFWWKNIEGKDHMENSGISERIKLTWNTKKQDWRAQTGFIWLRIWASGGLFCKHGNEPPSSTKYRKFIDYLRNC
jgi:hypothetical protein